MRRVASHGGGLCALAAALLAGCAAPPVHEFDQLSVIAQSDIPRELQKQTLPVYRVEPPDILLIEAVHNIRPPTDPLRPGDELIIRASNTLPLDPEADPLENEFRIINGGFVIQPDGTVNLGPIYGAVGIAGMPLATAEATIAEHLRTVGGLDMVRLSITMPNLAGKQQILGEHLVRPDGTISLGIYGSIIVAGMTTDEIKHCLEAHLSQFIQQPEVRVEVIGYNSKVIYVITDGGGFGESVVRLPVTGNETVLDAIAQIQGLSDVSSKRMWVARPAPAGCGIAQTMLVDYRAITQDGVTTTNYQLYPGDRIYIQADHLIHFDNAIAKITSPFERIFGFILLGHGTVRTLQFGHLRGGNGGGGFGGGFP